VRDDESGCAEASERAEESGRPAGSDGGERGGCPCESHQVQQDGTRHTGVLEIKADVEPEQREVNQPQHHTYGEKWDGASQQLR
jgi:hypothetical protein